jgi:putative protease
MGEWTKKYGSQATQRKVYGGKVTNYFKKLDVAEIKLESHDLKLGDEVYVIGETTGVYEDKLQEIRLDLKPVQQVVKGDVFSIKTGEMLRRNDKVYKIIYVEEDDLMA